MADRAGWLLLGSGLLAAGCAGEGPAPGTTERTVPQAASIAVAPAGPRWIEARTGCGIWNSFPRPGESVVWTGICADGYGEGAGRLLWNQPSRSVGADGRVRTDPSLPVTSSVAEGTLRRGRMEGPVTIEEVDPATDDTVRTLRGGLVDGRLDGPVHEQYASGIRVDVIYRSGRRDGFGEATLPNGDHYRGQFRANYWDGQGTLSFGHGSSYVGEFRHGQADGEGRATVEAADNGDHTGKLVVSGTWRRDCMIDRTPPMCLHRQPAPLRPDPAARGS